MAGQGKKTSFDGMTHEQMLAWLDDADAGTVQAAADKLASAAKEIHSIADELKVRPQWVKWKGEGADSFRQWAGKLANATVALGDYSQESGKWLGHAAQAISTAKTSVPRDKNVDANIDAARSAHNDPDAQSVLSKNMAVRQQTADELEKLGQAYSLSSSQMAAARKPEVLKFPPPPTDIQDPDRAKLDGGGYRQRPGTASQGMVRQRGIASDGSGGTGTETGHAVTGHTEAGTSAVAEERRVGAVPTATGQVSVDPDTRMDIDSVAVLPDRTAPISGGPVQGAPASNPGPTNTPTPGLLPPMVQGTGGGRGASPATGAPRGIPTTSGGGGTSSRGAGPTSQGTTGRPTGTSPRGPIGTGQGATATGRPGGTNSPGRLPTTNGVAGGRPQPATGRTATGIPRGTVVGGESAAGGRGAASAQGPVVGRANTPGSGARAGGGPTGRRVGGATPQDRGIVGGRAQQGSKNARSFSSGGSGLLRGQSGAAGASAEEQRTSQAGRGVGGPHGSRPGAGRKDERSERPDYVTEDERTWQPDERRNVPPVVADVEENDDVEKSSER